MKNVLKRSLSVLLAIAIIFSSAYVGLNELDFSDFFVIKTTAASINDLSFELNEDGESYSVDDCKDSAEGEIVVPGTYNGLPVTSIEMHAFQNCKSLTSITIPNGVTYINVNTFFGCSSLKSVTLPEGVKEIGYQAFRYCSSLELIRIPDSVTYIDDLAFSDCTSLKSIRIPNNVTEMGHVVFGSCKSLTSVIIGDSLERMSFRVFENCTSLASVTFPNSLTSIPDSTFEGCYPENIVFYCEQGSYAETWLKSKGYNYILTKYNETSENFTVRALDSKGNPVPNATVVIKEGTKKLGTYTTNNKGFINHEGKVTLSNITFTVSADGYATYYSQDSGELSDAPYYTAVLYTDEEARLRLRSVYYYLSDKNYTNKTLKRNLITGSKELSKSYRGDKYFVLECTPYENTGIETYAVYQNNKKIASNSYGAFKLKLTSFDVGENIYILTTDSSGGKNKILLNLKISEEVNVEEYRLEISDKITFSVPDEVPLVGGSDCSFDIPDLPLDLAIEDGKLYAGINFSLYEYDSKDKNKVEDKENNAEDTKDTDEVNSVADRVSMLKKQLSAFYDNSDSDGLASGILGQKKYDELLGILKEQKKTRIPCAGEFEVAFCGYGEADWSESLDKLTIDIYFMVKGRAEKNWQTFIYAVPVTIEFGIGVEAQLHGKGSYNFVAKTLSGDIQLEITPQFDVFGGVGVSGIVAVGAYGTAELPIEIQLIGTSAPSGLNNVDLSAELGFKAYAGPFEYTKDFIGRTWHLYPKYSTDEAMNAAVSKEAAIYFDPYDLSNYSVQANAYLSNQSVWLGSSLPEDLSVPALLWENTYRNCQPEILSNDTTTILTFIGADTSKGDRNTATAMYSILDEEGKWSSPVRFDSDETFDTALSVCSCDEDIFAVYQNTIVSFDETVDEATYINNQAISVYKYDSSLNSFVIDTTFTDNGNYYRLPKVTIINDIPTVTWISSEDSDIFGQGTNNTLYYSQFDGGEWSDPQIFNEIFNINTIMDYSVGEVDGNFVAVLTLDSDNDLSTSDTNVVYYKNGSSTTILEGDTTNLQFAKLPSETEKSFVFVNNGILYSYNGTDLGEVFSGIGAPESVEILSDKILLTLSGDNCSNIYSLNYDSSLASYGTPFALTNQTEYIEKLTATEKNGKQILAMVNKDVTISAGSVEDKCDLSLMYLEDISDIVISATSYDKENAVPGCATAIDTAIGNYGSDTVTELTITVADEAGTVITEKNIDVTIQPGEELLYTIYFELPEKAAVSSKYKVTVVETDNEEDANIEDNSYEVDFGYSDLELGYEIQKVGSLTSVVINVLNKGTVATTGQLEVYFNGSEAPYQTFDLSELSSYETEAFYVDITTENLGGNTGTVSFKVTGENKEFYTHNNSDSVYIDITPTLFHAVESIDILTTVDYENKYIFTSVSLIDDLEKLLFIDPNYILSHINDSRFFGTGERLEVNDSVGVLVEDYTLIVEGDINGDGVCDVLDAAVAHLYSAGFYEPTQNEIYAANGCLSDEIDANSYQNVVNTCLAS